MDMNELSGTSGDSLQTFARYADKHQLYDTLQDLLRKVIVARPEDPLTFLADELDRKPLPGIVVLAPPTSDETDLCRNLARAMGAVYISAPSLLRTAVEKKSSLGTQALQALSRGALAPDRVMLELLQQRLAQSDAQAHGWVLEGFPRTREQATGLARRGILPSHMYVLDASDAALIDRAIAQRIDPVTGKEYDTRTSAAAAAPPDVRARLTAKANLREDAVRDRLAAFRRQLPGIIDALKAVSVNVLVPKNASASGSEVAEAVRRALQVRKAPLAEGNAMGFHRILLVGGEPGVRDSVGHKLEEDGHYLVYVSPQRILTEEISRRGPNAERFLRALKGQEQISDEEMLALIVARTSQQDCKTRGWLLLSSTGPLPPGILHQAAARLNPTRVLVLPGGDETAARLELSALEDGFDYPMHPFFAGTGASSPGGESAPSAAVAAGGQKSGGGLVAADKHSQERLPCMQDLEVLPRGLVETEQAYASRMATSVYHTLLRPVEWKVPHFC